MISITTQLGNCPLLLAQKKKTSEFPLMRHQEGENIGPDPGFLMSSVLSLETPPLNMNRNLSCYALLCSSQKCVS